MGTLLTRLLSWKAKERVWFVNQALLTTQNQCSHQDQLLMDRLHLNLTLTAYKSTLHNQKFKRKKSLMVLPRYKYRTLSLTFSLERSTRFSKLIIKKDQRFSTTKLRKWVLSCLMLSTILTSSMLGTHSALKKSKILTVRKSPNLSLKLHLETVTVQNVLRRLGFNSCLKC